MGKIKGKLEAMPWSYRLLVILGLLFISTILTSYSIYKNDQQTINELQNSSALPVVQKPVTKQEIRTFLESLNPEILQRIDAGKKKILICISVQDAIKLSNLSECVDFEKYLSIRQFTIGGVDSNDLGDPNVCIENYQYAWVNNGHYLYPKDALVNKFQGN